MLVAFLSLPILFLPIVPSAGFLSFYLICDTIKQLHTSQLIPHIPSPLYTPLYLFLLQLLVSYHIRIPFLLLSSFTYHLCPVSFFRSRKSSCPIHWLLDVHCSNCRVLRASMRKWEKSELAAILLPYVFPSHQM